jgi:heat shock protein HslJ/membrane-bound inhibitor of C-type lysozyme
MRRLALILFLGAAAGAQAQTPPATTPTQGQPPGAEVMYACPGGTDFSAAFSKDGELATLNVPGQPSIELSRLRSGSGFAYGDSYYELRGQGREATLAAAGRAMRCPAVGRPGAAPQTYQGGGLTITLFPDGIFRLSDRAGSVASLDVGLWAHEVDGGVRLVLRGGTLARRVFREVNADRLIAENGSELTRAATAVSIDGPFPLAGLYRDTQAGGLFTECVTGRTFGLAPGGAEPDLERAWTEATPSKEAQLYVEVVGRFAGAEIHADRFLRLNRDGACPTQTPRGAALRETDWRMVEIDGERPTSDEWRQRPRLKLDEQGKYSGSSGCNAVAGSYVLDGEGLRFSPTTTTLTACPPAPATFERRFLEALSAVRQAYVAGTTLDLLDGGGKRRLRFEARGR